MGILARQSQVSQVSETFDTKNLNVDNFTGIALFLDAQSSLTPTHVSPSIRPSVSDTFLFPFCQRLWALAKRRDDIVVVGMDVDKVVNMAADKKEKKKSGRQTKKQKKLADMELFMVGDMEVVMVADMVRELVTGVG